MIKMNKKGMTALEICMLMTLFVLAFLAMRGYFLSAIQGNWKKNVDSLAEGQYDSTYWFFDLGSDIIRIAPSVKVDLGAEGVVDLKVVTANSGKIIKLSDWGTFE